jgi:RimJ/RimL family protein N-acetyltransferase
MNGRDPFPDLVLRPVVPADVVGLVASLARSSQESRYWRFFTPVPDPAPFVRRLVQSLDGHDHAALVVLDGERVIALAQWDRSDDDAGAAEVAITVEDAWQRRGLGKVLIRALAGDAHRHGIGTLTASVLAENHAARQLASRLAPASVTYDGSATRYTYALAS